EPIHYGDAVTFEITSGQESGPVVFDAVVEIRPSVTVAGYNGLRVELPSPTATDDEVDEQLDALRSQFAELVVVDRPAGDGDHVTIDITGTIDGDEVPGLTAGDYDYEVGTGAVVAEIDEHLRGASAGDELEFEAAPPDLDDGSLLEFVVIVKEVKELILPDLDDEFAAENSDLDTVEALRADIRSRITAVKALQARVALQQRTAEALAELVDDDIPEALVAGEVSSRLQELVGRLQQQEIGVDEYLERIGKSAEEITTEMREPAALAVRIDLGLRAVADAEELWPDEAAVDSELEELVPDAEVDGAEMRRRRAESGRLSQMRADLAKRRALDWLTDNVEIVDPDGDQIDRSLLEPPEAQDGDAADDTIEQDHDTDDEPTEGDRD
ncbi:MAG: trigger factor, partial [Acidimicrobiales bacterium]